MKKKILLVALAALPLAICAQVGIGNNVNTFDDSEILKIVSDNKGILIPNISIPNLNQANPVTNPATSLLVFNTNTNTGTGYYVWKNNKWNPLLNSSNISKYLGIINSSTTVSSSFVTDNTLNGANQYSLGSSPTANPWKQIPNINKNVNIFSPTNNVTINVNGIVQVQNPNNNTTTNSYAVGVFIDDKLTTVRNYIITAPSSCTYMDFNIMSTAENLSVGSHNVKVYAILRNNTNNSNVPTLYFGDKISTCTNLSSDMARTIMNIQVSEKP